MSKNWHAQDGMRAAEPAATAGRKTQIAVHIGFVVCMAAFVALYAQDYVSLITFWAHAGTFQYALLIFPVSAVLVWARRQWLARVAARPRPIALWAVAAIIAFWLLGSAADVNLAVQIAMIVIWPVMVYAFYGPRVTRILAFPLGYLLFAIPARKLAMGVIVGPLQTVTAHLAVFALKLSSLPVFMDGHFIETPATTWHVAQACSGIKFFIATTAFGVLYAYLFYNKLRRRLIFIGFSLVVPIIANALRVYFTILIGEHFGLQYATGTDHMVFGWQFFGTVLVLLFLCGWPWHEPPPPSPAPDTGLAENGSRRMRWIVPLALALIVIPPAWYGVTGQLASHVDSTTPVKLPARLDGLQAMTSDENGTSAVPINTLDVHVVRRYGARGHPIRIEYMGGLHAARAGVDIVNLRTALYKRSKWRLAGKPTIEHADTSGMRFVALNLTGAGSRRTLLYVYRIGGHWTTSAVRFKAWKTLYRLLGRPTPVGILAISRTGQADPSQLAAIASAAAQALGQQKS
jgi:exosortase A